MESDPAYVDIVFRGEVPDASLLQIEDSAGNKAAIGRFVEVENPAGKSTRLGEWVFRADGSWALRLSPQDLIAYCRDLAMAGAGRKEIGSPGDADSTPIP